MNVDFKFKLNNDPTILYLLKKAMDRRRKHRERAKAAKALEDSLANLLK